MLILHHAWRSSASRRVRLCLEEKGLVYESHVVDMASMEHHSPEYLKINPNGVVPALIHDGRPLYESGTICEYLDEVYPDPPLLPKDPIERAHVRAVAQIIACDIHPLNNTGPLSYLRRTLKADQSAIQEWYRHWIVTGFEAVEALIRPAPYAFGRHVTVADICIVPQVANARRFNVPLDRFPGIVAVDAAATKLSAFDAARPELQPDAE